MERGKSVHGESSARRARFFCRSFSATRAGSELDRRRLRLWALAERKAERDGEESEMERSQREGWRGVRERWWRGDGEMMERWVTALGFSCEGWRGVREREAAREAGNCRRDGERAGRILIEYLGFPKGGYPDSALFKELQGSALALVQGTTVYKIWDPP